jgi:hypothetical protein
MSGDATKKRLDKMYGELTSEHFLKGRGRGNELGFWVFDYPPEDEMMVREHLRDHVLPRLSAPASPHRVLHVDLYELLLQILEERGILDRIAPMEERDGLASVHKKAVDHGPLAPAKVAGAIVDKVAPDTSLLILSGVGKAYPLVRSHTILNNLHDPLGQIAVLLMFPGIYDQRQLSLFGCLADANYYRAFRLVGDV